MKQMMESNSSTGGYFGWTSGEDPTKPVSLKKWDAIKLLPEGQQKRKELHKIFRVMDKDDDGLVEYSEFKDYIK